MPLNTLSYFWKQNSGHLTATFCLYDTDSFSLILLFYLLFLFFSHLLCPDQSFPSLLFPAAPPPLSSRSIPPLSPQKRAGTTGKSTKHSMTNYDKFRHITSHQGSTRQQSGRKRVPQSGKRIRGCPYPTFRNPTTTPSYSDIAPIWMT